MLPRQRERLPHPPVLLRQPHFLEQLRGHLAPVRARHLRQPVHLIQRQPERLAHLAQGQPPPVADDLAHHARAVPAVLLVDVLQHLLAPLVLEVHVDVRRLLALHAQEALEEQPHAHRINGRDAQRVAHRRVGRAPAPLAEDAPRAREAHDVPDGQEVAREVQGRDELELVLDLLHHVLGRARRVAPPQPLVRQLAQPRGRRVARGQVLLGEVVAQAVQRRVAAARQLQRALERLGAVGEQPRHLLGPLERALGVGQPPRAQLPERRLVADGGEHVLQRLAGPVVRVHVVVRAQGRPERPSPARAPAPPAPRLPRTGCGTPPRRSAPGRPRPGRPRAARTPGAARAPGGPRCPRPARATAGPPRPWGATCGSWRAGGTGSRTPSRPGRRAPPGGHPSASPRSPAGT